MMVRKLRLDRRAFAIAGLVCLGLLPSALILYHVRSTWIQIPFWDEWATPGREFESWCRGSFGLSDLLWQHNESRKFFPRLLYFALAMTGGWDVRKEITVFFRSLSAQCAALATAAPDSGKHACGGTHNLGGNDVSLLLAGAV